LVEKTLRVSFPLSGGGGKKRSREKYSLLQRVRGRKVNGDGTSGGGQTNLSAINIKKTEGIGRGNTDGRNFRRNKGERKVHLKMERTCSRSKNLKQKRKRVERAVWAGKRKA